MAFSSMMFTCKLSLLPLIFLSLLLLALPRHKYTQMCREVIWGKKIVKSWYKKREQNDERKGWYKIRSRNQFFLPLIWDFFSSVICVLFPLHRILLHHHHRACSNLSCKPWWFSCLISHYQITNAKRGSSRLWLLKWNSLEICHILRGDLKCF